MMPECFFQKLNMRQAVSVDNGSTAHRAGHGGRRAGKGNGGNYILGGVGGEGKNSVSTAEFMVSDFLPFQVKSLTPGFIIQRSPQSACRVAPPLGVSGLDLGFSWKSVLCLEWKDSAEVESRTLPSWRFAVLGQVQMCYIPFCLFLRENRHWGLLQSQPDL